MRYQQSITGKISSLAGSVILGLSAALVISGQTDDSKKVQETQLKRAEERAKDIRRQQPKSPDIRVDAAKKIIKPEIPLDEKVCFNIAQIELEGDDAGRFQFALSRALKLTKGRINQKNNSNPLCLGAESINALMAVMQNAVIDRGYVTTRILAKPQDLKSGKLILTVIPGRVRKVILDQKDGEVRNLWRPNALTALPFQQGKILNLRDIEQGLENLKRVPTVEANINIVPADKPNESDLVIVWEEKKIPIRGNINLDDSGGQATGKYQGNVTIALDNPFSLNDLIYFSYGRDVLGYDKITDNSANETGLNHGGAKNWSVYYSVPFGKWQLTLDASSYRYQQLVAGANQDYVYRGQSQAQNITISRMMYRDKTRKLSAYLKGWSRSSNNFIDDTEIEVQRRKTAGYEVGLAYKQFIGQNTLDAGFGYKRGTGANGSLHAPEELFGEGTSRMKIYTADLNLNVPFVLYNRQFSFNTSFHGQLNGTPLTAQDKLSIGDRRTVRGFDGELRLLADCGFFLQNEFAMRFRGKHQIYLGFDGGHLAGPSTEFLIGKTLIGSVLGVRGQIKVFKNFSYDAFVGKPIFKPDGFRTAQTVVGFNLNYTF